MPLFGRIAMIAVSCYRELAAVDVVASSLIVAVFWLKKRFVHARTRARSSPAGSPVPGKARVRSVRSARGSIGAWDVKPPRSCGAPAVFPSTSSARSLGRNRFAKRIGGSRSGNARRRIENPRATRPGAAFLHAQSVFERTAFRRGDASICAQYSRGWLCCGWSRRSFNPGSSLSNGTPSESASATDRPVWEKQSPRARAVASRWR